MFFLGIKLKELNINREQLILVLEIIALYPNCLRFMIWHGKTCPYYFYFIMNNLGLNLLTLGTEGLLFNHML